jgi:hypothetical protein
VPFSTKPSRPSSRRWKAAAKSSPESSHKSNSAFYGRSGHKTHCVVYGARD